MKNKNFDFIAPYYDFLSKLIFGQRLRIAQTSLLPLIPKGLRILVVGGGTGWILPELVLICQPSEIVYIEKSSEMLALSKQKVPSDSPIHWVCGGEETFQNFGTFDVVFTPFFLDLFPESFLNEQIITPLASQLKENGYWLLVDFFPTTQFYFTFLTKVMYTFFGLVSGVSNRRLSDYPRLLLQHNLHLQTNRIWMKGYVKAQLWQKSS